MAIQSTNPTTREVIKTFEEEGRESVERKMSMAHEAFLKSKDVPIAQRAAFVKRMAEVLRVGKEEYARLMALEMGKPIAQARSEVEKCAWACEVAGEYGPKWLEEEVIIPSPDLRSPSPQGRGEGEGRPGDPQKAYIRFEPLGVILAIMPWNFPFWQFFRFAAGALVAGNAIVLKHASNVPQCALAIEEVFHKAGAGDGLVQVVLIGSGSPSPDLRPPSPLERGEGEGNRSIIESLIADPRIAAVTLTGSTTAGKKVAEAAGRNVKKCVLELGGSDPFIVLADADIARAAQVAVQARTLNAGQSCIAAKRFIVVKEIAEEFTKKFVAKMKNLIVGDPMDENTQVGPLARRDLVDELDRQVKESTAKGAKLLCGGQRIAPSPQSSPTGGEEVLAGYFYEPTVLTDVKPGMPAYREELFGPVASVIIAEDADEAVRIANDSIYGLGAAIWTKDIAKAKQMACQLECGAVFINDFVKSDPRLPFGGVKKSGYGRELGIYGIKEFVNIKTVVVK
ncbi:hypothetical protein A3B21_01630 [Candidatus Uhrbacteria bacterium RIFCSPLOWO2_01_FULL_47_24]|uniref:Aldehyde dehydrogenase domain-containing protein n=1 Tax=Candidatus Uhrbacteria bacterium RIFCSPLOWO2_01_FULL_47_24 TaxID=1802401 RepID=A0A1F7US54_9BACT|nr:MAG: hypothetical protein A3B21_01630 [Candidatus Uhrbacteria bacterium RIFCSPLOWO2_01_FULL_47_24]